jgi:hypothetical protein
MLLRDNELNSSLFILNSPNTISDIKFHPNISNDISLDWEEKNFTALKIIRLITEKDLL